MILDGRKGLKGKWGEMGEEEWDFNYILGEHDHVDSRSIFLKLWIFGTIEQIQVRSVPSEVSKNQVCASVIFYIISQNRF